jgi:hypothetical protein
MPTETTLESFTEQVQAMRSAQKGYFRFHSKSDLKRSIELEKRVDDLIKSIIGKQTITEQKNLFS